MVLQEHCHPDKTRSVFVLLFIEEWTEYNSLTLKLAIELFIVDPKK